MRSHLLSPDAMNWSMIDLRAVGEVAELRLPQHQRVRIGQAVAVFEAQHGGFRQQRVDDLERAWPCVMLLSGSIRSGWSWSISTAWRWLNVPRWQSSPDRRTRKPSSSSVPKASASAVAQSMPWPSSIILRRLAKMRVMVLCGVKLLGKDVSLRPTSLEHGRDRRRSRRGAHPHRRGRCPTICRRASRQMVGHRPRHEGARRAETSMSARRAQGGRPQAPSFTRIAGWPRADNGEGIDWSTAESLAYGTLLVEGFRVRLSARIRSAAPSPSAMPC